MDTTGPTSIWYCAGTSLRPRREEPSCSSLLVLLPTAQHIKSQGELSQGDFLIYNGTVVEYF